jgi:hypothetical protein
VAFAVAPELLAGTNSPRQGFGDSLLADEGIGAADSINTTFTCDANVTATRLESSAVAADQRAGGVAYWTANACDAELHLTQQTAGNGVVTGQGFDPQTGRLQTILAGAGNIVENFSYTYDVLGNRLRPRDQSAFKA